MTIPIERFNAVKYTREFLRTLLDPKKTPKVPSDIRRQAASCLRHFPGEFDLKSTQKKSPLIWGTSNDE